MRAVTYQGVGAVRVESVAEPALETPDDAIVEVERTAICGSDLHIYHGRERGLDMGTVLGHELIGRVVAAGNAVRIAVPGTRVAAPFSTSCGACFFCLRGLTARCELGRLFGWVENGTGLHGAQAERVRVPMADATLFPIGDDLPATAALLLADILPTGYHCAKLAGISAGDVVVVVGCGPVGLMAVAAAESMGAQVIAMDSVAARRGMAASFGARAVAPEECAATTLEATGGRGADAVLELVGSPEASRAAFDLVRAGGVIAACGVHHERHFPFSPLEAYDRNLRFAAGRCPARARMPEVLPWLERTPRLAEVFTHQMPLEDAVAAYDLFDAKRDGCIKIALDPHAPAAKHRAELRE
jgi:threonine dehydrogenase-like Zn-dependent dehydrogenase